MKKTILNIILILFIVVGFNSCNDDLLEPVPETNISDLSAFDTKERIEAQVRGIYSAFKSGQYLGGRYQMYNSIRGDHFINHRSNSATGLMVWNNNVAASSQEVLNVWAVIYISVNRINMFLNGMEQFEDYIIDNFLLTREEYDQYIGEALALRALAYHNLIQFYAHAYNRNPDNWGAILRITAQRSSDDNHKARATLAETYEQILADLNLAESLMMDVSGPNSESLVTRLHKSSVIALKTRIYLHMSDWENVIAEADKIVSASAPFVAPEGVQYALNPSFENIFRNYTTSESIFSIPMTPTEQPGTQNGLAHYFSPNPIGNSEYSLNQDSKVWTSNAFPHTDARRQLTDTFLLFGNEEIFIAKYIEDPHLDWAPVMRYAEVILNLAEAEAMNASSVNARALELLNAVFLRANPNEVPLEINNLNEFIDRVLLERSMEFIGEGLDNMDIQRTGDTYRAKGEAAAIDVGNPNYIWPIPQSEQATNNLVQLN